MKLPAGLVDNNLEILRNGQKTMAVCNGMVTDYLQLPSSYRKPFIDEMDEDTAAYLAIRNVFGLTNESAIEAQFVWCRYGQFDSTPDYDAATNKTNPDAAGCDDEDSCPAFGIACLIPKCVNGHLTCREYKVIKHVSNGKQDVEIADLMGIKTNTVRTYMERIHQKLSVNNRNEIIMWAKSKGL